MPIDPVRDAAIDVLLRVFERDHYLDESLDKTLRRKQISDRGRRFLTQLVYGTVRHKLLCDYVLARLVTQPLEKLPAPIHAILRMGVFQILFCNQVTPPAMVHTSVELAKKRGHAGTARLVNAVLKRVPHSLDELVLPDPSRDLVRHLSVRFSTPEWLVRLWADEHGPETATALCEASDVQAPVTIRVNTLATSAESLIQRMAKAGVSVEQRTGIPEELTLLEGPPPARSKLFADGEFLVQDPSSMLPPHLLEPKPGEWILDMCAAPGSKTTHLAQLAEGQAHIVACDVRRGKMMRIAENVERMEMPGIRLVQADSCRPPFVPCFDRVLVDAPCSGLGTLRRHPDLKWRATPENIERLAAIQRDLLRSAIGLCKNQGVIVYSVCTFTKKETEALIAEVLEHEPVELENGPQWLEKWKTGQGMYRTLPHEGHMDGFFLTRLRKRS